MSGREAPVLLVRGWAGSGGGVFAPGTDGESAALFGRSVVFQRAKFCQQGPILLGFPSVSERITVYLHFDCGAAMGVVHSEIWKGPG